MDPKLYLLAFFATMLSNNWKFAHCDEYLTSIILKLDEVKNSVEQHLRSEVEAIRTEIAVWKSTLESKVDRVLNEIQGFHDHDDTRGKLFLLYCQILSNVEIRVELSSRLKECH